MIRLLEGRFDLGEMDDPSLVEWSKIPYSAMSTKASAQVALEMARQTIVLLQNKGNILPLQKGKEKIAVIGPNANNEPMMWGPHPHRLHVPRGAVPAHRRHPGHGLRSPQHQASAADPRPL